MFLSRHSFFVVMTVSLAGCEHYQPMAFPPQNGEREKSGLFSGKTGVFEIPVSSDPEIF